MLDGDSEWKVLLVFIFFKKAGGAGEGEKEAGWEVHVHILHLETPCCCSRAAGPSAGRPHNGGLCGAGGERDALGCRPLAEGLGGDPWSDRAQLPHGLEKMQIPMAWSSQGEMGSDFWLCLVASSILGSLNGL